MRKYSKNWFKALYDELGDGISCFRSTWLYDGEVEDGALVGCLCCKKNTRLCLLPDEEKVFEAQINETDFRLQDNPELPGRKTITCSKMGLCDGRKPFVCRTAPFHFAQGEVLIEESLCRLRATTFARLHRKALERVRQVVHRFGVQHEVLGYGRRVDDEYVDFDR